MKTTTVCGMILGALFAAGCSAGSEPSSAEAETHAAPVLAMEGGWSAVAMPDGASVEDYVVSTVLPDTAPARIWVVARGPSAPGTIRSEVTVLRSSDGGHSFEKLATIPGVPTGAHVTVAPRDDAYVYVTAGGVSSGMSEFDSIGKMWISTDHGATFQPSNVPGHDAPVPETSVALDINPDNARHVVGATCKGLFRSLDAGLTWTRVPNSPDLTDEGCVRATLHRAPSDRDTMYISYAVGETFGGRVKRTTNGAGTWEDVARIGAGLSGFAIHPNDANHIYSFGPLDGWLSSSDAGRTWFPHNGSLDLGPDADQKDPSYFGAELSNVAFDTFTGAEPTLYIANAGVMKKWVPMNAPEGGKFVRALEAPGSHLRALRFANLFESGKDGSPSPILVGIESSRDYPSPPARLRIARLAVVRP